MTNTVTQYEVIEFRDDKVYSTSKVSVLFVDNEYVINSREYCHAGTVQGCIDKYIIKLQEVKANSSFTYRRI